ncbi:MAG: hypothetical protein JWN34_5069 [Bryobacterales bacterium]|nr:hypothetical protein [Bryobacterales bacterium]
MQAISRLLASAFLVSGLALPQSGDTKPRFELADVHVSPPTRNPFIREPQFRNGRYEVRFATMVDLIGKAYGVQPERVSGGPNWVENDLYKINARAAAGTTLETAKPMLQSLLADRFSLAIRKDTKSVPSYALRISKRGQLKEAQGSGDPDCKFIPPTPPPAGTPPSAPLLTYNCRKMTMAGFSEVLSSSLVLGAQILSNKVTVDETALKGAFDFDFKYTPPSYMTGGAIAGAEVITLFDAMEKIGLKLEPVDVPLPVIFIESVNQKPTPNQPNIAEALHITPPPTEFEVAQIKLTAPDFRGMRLQAQPGGRINIAGTPLKFLIQQAWDLSDDMIVGTPKWMETERFDIVAKADMPGQVDIDDLWPMLRALLKDRFKLETHMETRQVTAYTLVSVKPKMKKADPASHTKYKEGAGADGKDPRDKNPILGRLVTVQNMTMAQFAEKLKGIAPGYIKTPVLDATGLPGGYDFTLSFSPAGAGQAPPGGGGRGGGAPDGPQPPAAGEASSAADPNGAVTLF